MSDELLCPKCNVPLAMASSQPGQPMVCPQCGQGYHVVDEEDEGEDEDDAKLDIAVKPHSKDPGQPNQPPMSWRTRSRYPLQGLHAGELACTFLAISIALDVAVIAIAWTESSQPFFRRLDSTSAPAVVSARSLFHLLLMFQFLSWYYYAQKNLAMLFAAERSFNPGLAVVSYFIPIVNIVAFYRATSELWRASDPDLVDTPTTWKESPSSSFILTWWIFSLISGVLGTFTQRAMMDAGHMESAMIFAIFASLFSAAVAYMQIHLIRSIMERQILRAEVLSEQDQAEAGQAATELVSDHA